MRGSQPPTIHELILTANTAARQRRDNERLESERLKEIEKTSKVGYYPCGAAMFFPIPIEELEDPKKKMTKQERVDDFLLKNYNLNK